MTTPTEEVVMSKVIQFPITNHPQSDKTLVIRDVDRLKLKVQLLLVSGAEVDLELTRTQRQAFSSIIHMLEQANEQ